LAEVVFALQSFAAAFTSAQGKELSAKTRKAIMKAKIFMNFKGSGLILLKTKFLTSVPDDLQAVTPCLIQSWTALPERNINL
jgi:hypothetical protein